MPWTDHLDNTFADQLETDQISTNIPRQVRGAHLSPVTPTPTAQAELIIVNRGMAGELGIPETELHSDQFRDFMSGNQVLPHTTPYAMCYGGHQFGNWAGQLGDGRAINLCQLNYQNKRYTLQLKGAGPTPYSRNADGRAVLRSSIREYLMSEAMYHLGVPTTRALSLCLTGDQVLRDMMYDGNAAYEKGAVVCRVSQSFIRFGNFQIFAARKDLSNLKKLLDYTLLHHYPHITGDDDKQRYVDFFREVSQKTLSLMIEWQRVGFVHGVMNTDNMSILGETIDYGPYGWVDNYDPDWTPNTTDRATKRYRFANQPYIGQWNLAQLANAIYPLTEEADPLMEILNSYKTAYQEQSITMLMNKIGLTHHEINNSYIVELDQLMKAANLDMTLFYRQLSTIHSLDSPEEAWTKIIPAYYDEPSQDTKKKWSAWLTGYLKHIKIAQATDDKRQAKMKAMNPKYVLRNYMAQMAIDEAEKGTYDLIHELYTLLQNPYAEQIEMEKWYAKRPEWAKNKIGCSALSCSS
jgi:uncharacterized protein YdiU (UPF0061 family)